MITFEEENRKQILNIISKISSTENIEKIKLLVKKLQSLTKGYPCCKICGEPLSYQLMKFKLIDNVLEILTPKCLEHEYDGNIYKLEKCYDCVSKHFKNDMPSMQRYLFQIRYRWAQWVYDIPMDIHEQIRSDKCGVTLKSLIRKWGKEDGEKRWKEYCKRQGEVNTLEYKQKKYGWTKEQFNEFNKLRACTIENFIERHGEIIGKQKWKEYVDKQKETKSWDYMVRKFGKEKAKEINLSKVLCFSNFVNKYGEEAGPEKYNKWLASAKGIHWGYSKMSQKLFLEIKNTLGINYTYYFAINNHEYPLRGDNFFYLLDFYIPELKICIEFDGDLWHANPSKFKASDKPSPFSNKTAEEIWLRDKQRQDFIESQGIKVVRIWESEYKAKDFNINEFITKRIGIELVSS